MTRLDWDSAERSHYSGVSHGVLYLGTVDAIPWNGLVSVVEKSDELETRTIHIDGLPVAVIQSIGDFGAKVSAYTYPNEFHAYTGYDEIATNQPVRPSAFDIYDHHDGSWTAEASADRITVFGDGSFEIDTPTAVMIDSESYTLSTEWLKTTFGLSYQVGDDQTGQIHLIYNARAVPNDKSWNSLSEAPEIVLFEWDILTVPIECPGFRPSAHFILDLSIIPSYVMDALRDVLYGSSISPPSLPTPAEIIAVFEANAIFLVIDNGDGSCEITGPSGYVTNFGDNTAALTSPSIIVIDSETYAISTMY